MEGAESMERMANSRTQLLSKSKLKTLDHNDVLFTSDELVMEAERFCAKLSSFSDILRRLRIAVESISPLRRCAIRENNDMLLKQIDELKRIGLQLTVIYENELKFKHDSIDDFVLYENVDVSSAILSCWKNGVYTDHSLLSCLYSLII